MSDSETGATGVQAETVLTAENTDISVQEANSDTSTVEGNSDTSAVADEEVSQNVSEDAEGSEAAVPEKTVPEKYEFSAPEGVELDSKLIEEVSPLFKELGLSQEQAQKLVDIEVKRTQETAQQQQELFENTMNEWVNSAKSDKEYGGEDFDKNIKVALTAVNKFGTPELRELLESHGVGNHPEMIRFMYRVGKLTQEDVPGAANPSHTEQDRVSRLYPNDRKA